jgi:catalase
MNFSDNYGSDPSYVGSSLQPTRFLSEVKPMGAKSLSVVTEHEKWVGQVSNFQTHVGDDDFVQPAALWEVIGREPGHQERFFGNVAVHLCKVKSVSLRNEVYGMSRPHYSSFSLSYTNLYAALFARINPDLGEGVKKATEALVSS